MQIKSILPFVLCIISILGYRILDIKKRAVRILFAAIWWGSGFLNPKFLKPKCLQISQDKFLAMHWTHTFTFLFHYSSSPQHFGHWGLFPWRAVFPQTGAGHGFMRCLHPIHAWNGFCLLAQPSSWQAADQCLSMVCGFGTPVL